MLWHIVFTGIYMGCIYGLVGMGFALIFNSSKIFNFAQGEFLMLGAMFYVTFTRFSSLPFVIALILCMVCMGLVGVGLEVLGINPLRKKNAEAIRMVMVTMAFGIIAKNLAEAIWGKYPMKAKEILDVQNVEIAGHLFRAQGVIIIGVSVVLLMALWYFFMRTKYGKAYRASAFNVNMAYLSGINVRGMVMTSFVLSGTIGGLAGVLVGPIAFVSSDMGVMLGVKGFCAAVIGGMGNPFGALIGGLLIGLSENIVGGYISTRLMQGLSFFFLILVLLIRPSGLLGVKA
jgi:branched-chain amino acid transport system permease protein